MRLQTTPEWGICHDFLALDPHHGPGSRGTHTPAAFLPGGGVLGETRGFPGGGTRISPERPGHRALFPRLPRPPTLKPLTRPHPAPGRPSMTARPHRAARPHRRPRQRSPRDPSDRQCPPAPTPTPRVKGQTKKAPTTRLFEPTQRGLGWVGVRQGQVWGGQAAENRLEGRGPHL